jgi:type I restriction enzyme S subunit
MTALTEKPKKGTPAAANAPWPLVRLGDVAKTSSGGTPKRTSPSYYGGGIPWVKSGELGDSTVYETSETISAEGLKNSSAKIFPSGTLCVALYGATVGKLGILGMDAATNQAVCGIFLPPNIDTRFIYRFLEHKRRDLVDMAKGGAQPNISQDIIRSLEIPLPPLPEQRRIVAEIEQQFTRLDSGIAALRRVQANLKRYRAAVLKAACEGRLVPTENERFESSDSYGPPSQLPKGWRWTAPAEICDQVVDCHNKTAPYTHSGIPLVRTTNIRGGKIDMSETRFVTQSNYEFWSRRCIPKPGDVIFTREAPMGEAGIIPDGVTLCMGQRMMLLRASPKILNRYLLTALIAPGLISHITRTAVGSGVKHLRVRDVESLPIPLPPLAEQTRIVAEVERRLSVVDELESVVKANLQRTTRLRQSILQNAFTGEHT